MKATLPWLAGLALAIWITACANSGINESPSSSGAALAALPPAARAANQFGFDLLHQELHQNPDQDLTFSPVSVWSALTLASAGAEGDTLKEMQATLHLPAADPDHAFYREAGALTGHLQASQEIEFRSANRLWVQSGLHLELPFLHTAQADFHDGLASADFRRAAPIALLHINAWVGAQTRGLIPQLLQSGDITSDTRLVLTNAVYFRGKWTKPWEAKDTQPQAFHPTSGPSIDVPMMSHGDECPYAENHWAQAIRLTYKGGASMLIVLPKHRAALRDISPRLTPQAFLNLLANLRDTPVEIKLPRFTTDQRTELVPDLKALGMQNAFGNAQFTDITRYEPLRIGSVIHQCHVEVSEEGTKAAAATALTWTVSASPPDPPQTVNFIADHPFLYFIVDDTSGAILFAGAVQHPS